MKSNRPIKILCIIITGVIASGCGNNDIATTETDNAGITAEIGDISGVDEFNAEVQGDEDIKNAYVINKTTDNKKPDDSAADDGDIDECTDSELEADEVGDVIQEEGSMEQFTISEIDDELFERIYGKSYKENCSVPREELRYLKVMYCNFNDEDTQGEIICNSIIADKLIEIFRVLYDARYPIERICLVDEYDADDERSMADNNSSCFNFRYISYTTTVSKHGKGLAIDINPLYNPYVKEVEGRLSIEPANAVAYVDRGGDFPHKIDENDLAYKLFTEKGFSWGGAWKNSKDYQHFEYNGE